MEHTVGVLEIGGQFEALVQQVRAQDESVVVEEGGERVAAVIPIHLYDDLRQQRRAEFFAAIREMQREANLSPEEAERVVDEAIAEVRAAQWQRRRAAFFDQMEEVSARANLAPEEADELAAEAVRAVRAAEQAA